MEWIYLGLAAVFEVMFAMSMKYSEGFTKLIPTIVTVCGVIGGITFLTLALKTLPVSVAYPIWTAVGTLGTVILGYFLLGESMSVLKIASALAIVAGITGLKISGG
ncbi:MAG: multidrug efflux SMR transporter [Proteobacteria bacterium]|nr:multidrug efflux SMR transporter [Burkholderiales bacterium]